MSAKLNFIVYLKGKLNHQLATLLAANDQQGAQNVQRFLGTSDHIHDAPKLMLTVQTLNNAIVTGTSSPANFNEYALAVVTALQA